MWSELPKLDRNYKPTDTRSSTNPNHKKGKKLNHKQITQNQ